MKRLGATSFVIVGVSSLVVAFVTYHHFWYSRHERTPFVDEETYFSGYAVDIPLDADTRTFVFLGGAGDGPSDYYAKDKVHVYDNGTVLTSADPSTFVGVYNSWGRLVCVRDADTLWFFADHPIRIIHGATVVATGGYCKTPDSVYMGANTVQGADARNFVGLNNINYGGYGKDEAKIYYTGFPIPGADARTFKIIDPAERVKDNYIDAIDKYNNYDAGQAIEIQTSAMSPVSFESLNTYNQSYLVNGLRECS